MPDDLVEMARLAQHDERMSTGALYGDLADRIEELEAKLELISEEWHGAVYGDLENGVASLNEAAAQDFHRRYPLVANFGATINRIIDGGKECPTAAR